MPFGYDPKGLVLTWLKPWDGQGSLELAELDPFYIEICRRIRLIGQKRVERGEFYPSRHPRIAAKEINGVVGDPGFPIDLSREGKPRALTFPPEGITAEHMRRFIFEDKVRLSMLQKPAPNWTGDLWLSVSVFVQRIVNRISNGFHIWQERIPKKPQHI